MKRSVPLSAIRDTPVSARLYGESEEQPPFARDSPFRADAPQAQRRHRPGQGRAFKPGPDWSCVMPGCAKRISELPQFRLCVAHLVVIHNTVAANSGPVSILIRRLERIDYTPTPVKRVMPTNGIVYFVQVGGHIKIGWTSDLTKRMRAYPPNAVLLATHAGERKDELRLHKMFAAHRSHGREWYPLAPVILAHIKRVIAEHGQPVEVIFGAKPVEVPRPHATEGHPKPRGWPVGRGAILLRG